MKTVRFPIVKLIVGLGVGITGCFFLIYILDIWFNGAIADFFYSNFVGVNYYRTETGATYTTEYIILSRVYWAMLIVLLILDIRSQLPARQRLCDTVWRRYAVWTALILAIAVFGAYGPGYNAQEFLYFQF